MTTFHQLLRDRAAEHGARTALLFDAETVTYATLLDRSERVAAGLRKAGIGANDHVALLMDNSLDCVFAWLASSLLGCTEVPINPQYRGQLLHYLLQDADVTAVICDAAYAAQLTEVAGSLPGLKLVLVGGGDALPDLSGIRVERFGDCYDASDAFDPVDGAPERVILYTSGTTGPSKGVTHTQRSCLTLSRYNAEMMEYRPDDRLLNFFPLYHQNARYTGVVPAIQAGASIRLERKLSTSNFWKTVDADGITAFNYLGSVLRLILNVTGEDRVAGTHSLRTAFGAGAPPAIWEAFEQRLGVRLVETYGLSEAPMAALNVRKGARSSEIGSAGRGTDLFELAVADADDNLLSAGEVGEIVLRPRVPDAMMTGYYNKDAATVRAFRNLWFHSGDRGRLSERGDLFFEAREKDAIRRRGENISAWEVESVLDAHPDVAESAVFGVASEDVDEEVAVAIVLQPGASDLRGLLDHAAKNLPAYAVPTLLRVMADLPRTPTEKVQKAELRAAPRAAYLTRSEILEAATRA